MDRRSETEDVLDAETLDRMTARPDVPERDGGQQFYGMGWHVVSNEGTAPSLWHNGSLPGSYGFLLHSPRDDLTAAALFNGRSTDRKYRTFNVRSRQMMIDAVGNVSSWPQRDLFDRFA